MGVVYNKGQNCNGETKRGKPSRFRQVVLYAHALMVLCEGK